jgi:hypothetical protein
MKVERQGIEECMLATVAALAGESLLTIRTEACSAAGVTRWADTFKPGQSGRYWDGITAVVDKYHLRPLITLWETDKPGAGKRFDGRWVLPAKGKGAINLKWQEASHRWCYHIAPWENGLIYDPNDPKCGQTLPNYLVRLERRVLHVTVLSITSDRKVIDKPCRKR